VTTASVTTTTSVTVSGSYGGATRTASLAVTAATTPPPSADTVSVQAAEYETSKRSLRVEATSSNSSAVMRVYVTSTGALIGTLSNDGGGRYRGEFSWPSNPQNVTVRSSLGGSASRTVSVK
jgi:hypothetical protein